MAWKEFELTKVTEKESKTYDLPYSAPAPIVQKADELLHGDTEGRMEGDKVNASLKTKNLEKASHHIVKEVLAMQSFPREKKLELKELDGVSLNKLKDHYMKVDIQGKNLKESGGTQNT